MMNAISRALAPITVLLLAGLAAAEPFNPALVGAGARWVVHIDVDRAREADGLRRLLRGHVDRQDVERLQRRLGVEMAGLNAEDFSFICAYGSGDGESEIAVIGAAPGAADWFASWMSRAGAAEDDRQVQQWVVQSWRRHGRLTAMTTLDLPGGGRAMIVADTVDEVVAGARVVAGQAPSLADAGADVGGDAGDGGGADVGADAALRIRPAAGSIVFIAAEGIDEFQGLRPRAVALRDAKRLAFDFGEDAQRMFLEARITAAGPEQAEATRDVFSGLRAWARMAIAQTDRARQHAGLLDAFTLRVDDADVIVTWSADLSSLPEAQEPAEAPSP